MNLPISESENQFNNFPGTRYMGSKNKLILEIWDELRQLEFETVHDAFAGSNVVGYFLKCKGKQVISNDFLTFSYITAKAIIENNNITLSEDDLYLLLQERENAGFIERTFKGIFFSDEDNRFLDQVQANAELIEDEYKKALALSSLVRACIKRRSRGIFTFAGERYNDGRLDMQKSLKTHFIESVNIFNKAVFNNDRDNKALNTLAEKNDIKADLIYIDPPYFTPKSDNDYVRRYHFVEGLVRNWQGLEIQQHSVVKKFKSYKSPFSTRKEAYNAFEELFEKYKNSILVISYSSNSLPTKDELCSMLKTVKKEVQVREIDHTYSFGNQKHMAGNKNNRVKEYLFIAK